MRTRLILTLAIKDWQLFWADKRAATLCFLVPILLASLFGLIFDRPPFPRAAVPLSLLIVTETDSPSVVELVLALQSSPRLEAECVTRPEAMARLAERHPGVAVVFPAEFAFRPQASSHDRPRLEIMHNPLCSTEAQWAEGVITEAIVRHLARQQLGQLLGEAAVAAPFTMKVSPVTPQGHTEFNSYSHSFGGMTLQYLLFWGMESGLMLLRERQRGVWQRLRVAPVSLLTILFGKCLATAFLAMLQVLVTFTFGYFVFGVSVTGSFPGFILLVIAISGLSAATGLLVAAVGGTEARARSLCVLVILGFSMLGGLWLPAFLLPSWVRDIALSLPTTWAMRGLDGVTWQGQELAGLWPSLAMVCAMSAGFLALAVVRIVSQENRRRRGWATSIVG